jgi:hypothetical protein
MMTDRRIVRRLVLGCLGVALGFHIGSTPIGAQVSPVPEPPALLTIDDLFADVAKRAPAFGGMFVQDGTLQVYLLDTTQRTAAEAAIVAVFGRDRVSGRSLLARQGQYGFLQLKTWHDRHRFTTLAIPGVVTTGIAESKNRLQIGVKDSSVIPMVESELARLNIPRGAVDIVETAPIAQGQSLVETARPVVGGIQISNSGGGKCTMGFTAVRQGQAGFVTNSHCTATQGTVEGTVFHQSIPNDAINRFGVETFEPALATCGSRKCRLADVAFVRRDGGPDPATLPASALFGYIAHPNDDLVIDCTARLHGIVWGVSPATFTFSPMWNIEVALGYLKTYDDEPGANSPPEVKILKPASNVTVGTGGLNSVAFEVGFVDYEGCCSDVTWTSTLDGVIGTGTSFTYTFPTIGTRTITVTATDEDGATASDSIVVTVINNGPTVWIDKPTAGELLYPLSPYVFEGDSSDPNEPFNRLPCNALKWTSNNATDPFPQWGCTPQVTFSTYGSRVITVKGTDSSGASGSASVYVNVVQQPLFAPPNVTILQPAGNKTGFDANQTVWLKGTANDPDHKSPLTFTWKVKIGSTFKTLYTSTLADGQTSNRFWTPSADVPFQCGGTPVRLYLYVTDPDGMVGVAHVDTYIFYPTC